MGFKIDDDSPCGGIEQEEPKIVAGLKQTTCIKTPPFNFNIVGGGTGGVDVVFSRDFKVPNFGTLYLASGDVPTSSAPYVAPVAGTVEAMSVSVDDADATNDYDLELLVNGTLEASLTLAATNTKATASSLSVSVAQSDEISIRLVRTSGTGKSEFDNITAAIRIA